MGERIEIDDKSAPGLASFLSLPEKSETTIRFIDRTTFYTTHGDDALFVAREIFRTMGVVKYLGGAKNIPSVALSPMVFQEALRELLLVRQYRVEVYESKQYGSTSWVLAKKGSPGNLQMFEDVLFSSNGMVSNSNILALKVAQKDNGRVIGAAFADATLNTINVCEFADNDQFSNLEALIVQVGAKECLMPTEGGNADIAKMRQIVERSGIMITTRKKTEFNIEDIKQDLGRLLCLKKDVALSTVAELDLSLAMGSTAAIISYLELLSNESNFGQFKLSSFDFQQYMKLDAAAVTALNLLPSSSDNGNKNASLAGILNVCKTSQGSRLLNQWIKQPLLDCKKIEERLNLLEVFFENQELRQLIRDDCLKKMPDMHRISRKLQRGKGSLQDCVRIYQALGVLPTLKDQLSSYDGPHQVLVRDVFLSAVDQTMIDMSKLVELIELTVDLERAEQHEYVIKASYSEKLTETRAQMDDLEGQVTPLHKRVANELDMDAHKTLKLDRDSRIGFFFRLSAKNEPKIRNNKRFQVLETLKGGIKFTNTQLSNISSEYIEAKKEYEEEQAGIVTEVIDIVKGYSVPMDVMNDIIAKLDVVLSLADASANAPIPYVRPTINPKGTGNIRLLGNRHPCVEVQDSIHFIPNDVELIRGESEFQIITGPNMGGKSTYIRQIGVAVLMAQIGCFVPADTAEITVTDGILARVGAGDSQLKGVSTFMAEMLETASILKSATSNSLIIIDELGRGTSTYDGFGLAWAISEYIAKEIKSFCLFATHFHELTALSEQIDGVNNLHVTAVTTGGSLTLLYKVQPGICDQSFGIHVAELANFPKDVIELAKHKADELEDFDDASADPDKLEKRKRRRKEKEEGDELISKFLSSVRKLDFDSMGEADTLQALNKLREEVVAQDNSYVTMLVNTNS